MTTAAVEVPEAFDFLFDPPFGEVRYRVAHGGRGSAKSWSFAVASLILGAQRPRRILCAREIQASIRDSVHKLLVDTIDRLELGGVYEVLDRGIYGRNGTEFLFKGLRHNVHEIKSLEGIDLCWIEEAQAVSKASWDVLIPTIRKDGSEIWVSFNPDMEGDATYQRFVASAPGPRAIVRKVGYQDNPWLPDVLREEAEQLRGVDLEAYDHIWGGNPWVRSKASIFADKCVVQEFTPGEGWHGPYFGADWGFANDPSVLVKCWVHAGDLYIEYDVGEPQMNNDATAECFRQVPGAAEHQLWADSARPETINELRRRGLKVQAAPKWDGSVKDGIAHLRTYQRIVIHPRCRRVQEEAKLYRYKVDELSGDVLPVPVDKHNHTWDAIRYALGRLIRRRGFTTAEVKYGT